MKKELTNDDYKEIEKELMKVACPICGIFPSVASPGKGRFLLQMDECFHQEEIDLVMEKYKELKRKKLDGFI